MLTYELKKAPGLPLYEALCRCIREDILSGKLPSGTKLPSKRALAAHLEVSKVTVEGAYAQLLAEGYLRSEEKGGYFVEEVPLRRTAEHVSVPRTEPGPLWKLDLTANAPATGFPFSVWMRLQRQVMLDYGDKLLTPLPPQGYPELRTAIAEHLLQFRGMAVDPENILIGAGTDFLYNLLIQLLGRDKRYAGEDPGYHRSGRSTPPAAWNVSVLPWMPSASCPRIWAAPRSSTAPPATISPPASSPPPPGGGPC